METTFTARGVSRYGGREALKSVSRSVPTPGTAQVQPGDNVLMLVGSGSLGTAAVQFAKALGATVTASVSAKNTDLLWSLRAEPVVDYETEDPLKRHAESDVVFDTFGVSSFGFTKTALTEFGRHICPVLGLT